METYKLVISVGKYSTLVQAQREVPEFRRPAVFQYRPAYLSNPVTFGLDSYIVDADIIETDRFSDKYEIYMTILLSGPEAKITSYINDIKRRIRLVGNVVSDSKINVSFEEAKAKIEADRNEPETIDKTEAKFDDSENTETSSKQVLLDVLDFLNHANVELDNLEGIIRENDYATADYRNALLFVLAIQDDINNYIKGVKAYLSDEAN